MPDMQRFLTFRQWPRLTAPLARTEVLAGLTVALVMIPQAVAYAGLAGMPLVTGIYASLLPALVAVLFSASTRLSVGPTALTCLLVSASLSSLINVVAILIYAILVPLMVFFMLKDKQVLMGGLRRFLPRNRTLVNRVWVEMNDQIINYIRGKVIEILIVGVATYIPFALMGLRYSVLLAVAVGFSVLIPYIGAVAVTVPVAMVALFQWGLTPDFAWLMVAYLVIQALDGNLLVPLLFSEAVNLHPVAIIVAVLVFGGLWGFWGVFFAIPLATLVKAVLNAWPKRDDLPRPAP